MKNLYQYCNHCKTEKNFDSSTMKCLTCNKTKDEKISAIDKEIADKYREIKRILRDTNVQKETIRRQMLEKGIVANRIELTPASRNDVRVAVKQSEM